MTDNAIAQMGYPSPTTSGLVRFDHGSSQPIVSCRLMASSEKRQFEIAAKPRLPNSTLDARPFAACLEIRLCCLAISWATRHDSLNYESCVARPPRMPPAAPCSECYPRSSAPDQVATADDFCRQLAFARVAFCRAARLASRQTLPIELQPRSTSFPMY